MLKATISFVPGMRHQQQDDATGQTYGLPALLTVFNPVMACDMQRVIEHQFSRSKADTVFALVALVFCVIP